jgi:hypothetical protein
MADKPKKKRKLTPRQRNLIKRVAGGATLTDAAIAAGYKSTSPAQAGHQAMQQIAKSGLGADLLDRFGLTDEVLVERYLKPLLEAHETKFFAKDGLVVTCFDVVDLVTRRYALDMCFRLKGKYKAEEENTAQGVKVFLIDRSTRPPRPAINIPTLAQVEDGTADR